MAVQADPPVEVDLITTPGGQRVLRNLKRKAEQADLMFSSLCSAYEQRTRAAVNVYDKEMELPAWAS